MRMLKNTEKSYPCVHCGNSDTNIVREGSDPRLKCSRCNGMFDASSSTAAQEAGAIPTEAPKLQDQALPPVDRGIKPNESSTTSELTDKTVGSIPKTINYVFIAKDRSIFEFCGKRDLMKTALKWQTSDKKFNVFELQPKQVSAKVDIT